MAFLYNGRGDVSLTYSPQGDGNARDSRVAMWLVGFHLPIPRKGMETLLINPTTPSHLTFHLPIPRKGMETHNSSSSHSSLSLVSLTYSPQGDGNVLYDTLLAAAPEFHLPIPRKGMETVNMFSWNSNRSHCFTYLFPARGWKRGCRDR